MRLPTLAAALAVAVALAAPGGIAHAEHSPSEGAHVADPNPLLQVDRWFVDTDWHPSWRSYRRLRRQGRTSSALHMLKIARQPQFRWFGKWDYNPYKKIQDYFRKIRRLQPGAVPSVTIFRHLHPRSAEPNSFGKNRHAGRRYRFRLSAYRRYLTWVKWFARGIGRRRVVIAFEPDALGSFIYLSRRDRRLRFAYLRRAISVLSRLPNATIYIEAGASDWRHAHETARLLRRVGIGKVRGFMLNVTHFDWTSRNIRHGMRISRLTGGKPFVVSTHANGRGPRHYRRWYRGRRIRVNVWCNPRNSGLGRPPAVAPDPLRYPKLDAYLWIGRAGYSGGRCGGGPRAGRWWTRRALTLARRAPWSWFPGPLEYR